MITNHAKGANETMLFEPSPTETRKRIAELADLYRASGILNQAGFNLSTAKLEREAQEYGVDLRAERATESYDTRARLIAGRASRS
jgi:hypothetical protein